MLQVSNLQSVTTFSIAVDFYFVFLGFFSSSCNDRALTSTLLVHLLLLLDLVFGVLCAVPSVAKR